jgi:hypothetical protein
VAIINSTFVFYDTPNKNTIRQTCHIDDQNYFIGSITDTFYGCVLPFAALITCSILIISGLKATRQRLATSQNTEIVQRREKRDFEFFRTLLSLDLVFLFFYFPYIFFNIFMPYSTFYDVSTYQTIKTVLFYIHLIGFSNNLAVYCIFNKEFRSEIFSLFKLKSLQTSARRT